MNTIPYIPFRHHDGTWYALLVNGEDLGPYVSLQELERDMASIQRHLVKSFGGAK